jgi:hypothetical protein
VSVQPPLRQGPLVTIRFVWEDGSITRHWHHVPSPGDSVEIEAHDGTVSAVVWKDRIEEGDPDVEILMVSTHVAGAIDGGVWQAPEGSI